MHFLSLYSIPLYDTPYPLHYSSTYQLHIKKTLTQQHTFNSFAMLVFCCDMSQTKVLQKSMQKWNKPFTGRVVEVGHTLSRRHLLEKKSDFFFSPFNLHLTLGILPPPMYTKPLCLKSHLKTWYVQTFQASILVFCNTSLACWSLLSHLLRTCLLFWTARTFK